jgi:hypothetical protein
MRRVPWLLFLAVLATSPRGRAASAPARAKLPFATRYTVTIATSATAVSGGRLGEASTNRVT